MFNVDTHCDVSVGVGQDLKLVFVAQEELIRLLNVNGRPSILLFCILRHLINKRSSYLNNKIRSTTCGRY